MFCDCSKTFYDAEEWLIPVIILYQLATTEMKLKCITKQMKNSSNKIYRIGIMKRRFFLESNRHANPCSHYV